ncbi:AAA family ATPase [Lysinibacillus sp. CNPSo 3705]|uniref:AAA family ATPase n=1 Tax=Lysinibacillus sp. CNPSo 3705 TaxID=3028148 RepID=UPI003082603E
MDRFYREKAKELKEYKNPQITKTSYDKNDFLNDISACKVLDEIEINEYENILNEISKSKISEHYQFNSVDFTGLINNVNEILEHKVQEVTFINELKDDPARKGFAQQGLKIHKAGENCSFCGNEIKEERIKELESFISVSAIQEVENKINNQIETIDRLMKQVNGIEKIKKDHFYSAFHEEIEKINTDIKLIKYEYNNLFDALKDSLNEKAKGVFRTIKKVDLGIPTGFSSIEKNVNDIITAHDDWVENIESKQKNAMEKLRLHYVGLKLREEEEYKRNWRGYQIEQHELTKLKERLTNSEKDIRDTKIKLQGSNENPKENTIAYLKNEIEKADREKDEILKSTKSTYKFVEIINAKLKKSGKTNLELTLEKDENGIEHYQIKDKESVRSIDKLSTGEKNIIGFLYFLESLSDVEKQSDKNKVIVFDDPMNSNDDTMQYMIITEIQKLYTDKYRNKFNSQKDIFVCLTHNAHFYLNVQPQGNFKEPKIIDGKKVEISKYDKNYFYRLENGEVKRITSQREDFNTHYELLWIELQSLYSNNLLNSMLNSMRRIIETYTKFNKINPVDFYKDKEEHKKLFDVNSHSIDDHSMETIGKDKDSLIAMFKELFESNNAIGHFNTYWKEIVFN